MSARSVIVQRAFANDDDEPNSQSNVGTVREVSVQKTLETDVGYFN